MHISQIDFSNILKHNLLKNIVQPRRAQIYIGFQCHQKCGFCYYKHSCQDPMFDFDKVKQQIDFEYEYGIRDFEITGGEPSEYKELRKVCLYIKEKSPISKIAIITNGGLWQSDIWDIIDEVLVSYHTCQDNALLDKDIFPLGSTYNKVKKTIDLAHSLNKFVRTNTVCATFNLDYLDKIVDDLVAFKPSIINFLPVNLFDQAKTEMNKYIDYNIFRKVIKTQIDKIKTKLNCQINIRYMPFCDMEGYEQYIVGQLQHIYDEYDWNRELGGTNLLELIKDKDKSLKTLGKYGSTSIQFALKTRKYFYEKYNSCLNCKYQLICDGVEKTLNHSLLNQIVPSKGKIIKNFMCYR